MFISVVTLPVSDLNRAIAFYTDTLGWLKTMDEPMGDGTQWVTVAPNVGATAFTLSTPERDGTASPGFTGVILECDDVNVAHARLTKLGVTFEMPPTDMPWGGWAMFKDSEGNVLGLHSPVRVGAK